MLEEKEEYMVLDDTLDQNIIVPDLPEEIRKEIKKELKEVAKRCSKKKTP